ncbi:MAG: AAA-like domain-containing protein [Armatimonadetes bacterium]|nr:AAA-like domain-containing protein [Armatimonadota bacterium]
MNSPQYSSPQLEIAHVLFMDIVGYSRLPMEQQTRLIQELQHIVRETSEFRRAEEADELIRLPTGDGMALVFFRDPAAPVRCAIEIARAARQHGELPLRMGIHSGPVVRQEDINASINVAGGGVNMAQRVMDCGDAGHLLLSRSVAEVLSQFGAWADMLHDIGCCEVKHGVQVTLFNLCTDEVGNPELPQKLRPRQATSAPVSPVLESPLPSSGIKVALLYKRHTLPDEKLLSLLEERLRDKGLDIFVDRHLTIGVEWAQEIERKVREADAVIPLLSASAVHSEMLAYEIQTAHEAAQVQNGKPRILPVRLQYEGPLPPHLAGLLDPIEYAHWEGPQDDERLVNELATALLQPPPQKSAERTRWEAVGGAVPLDSEFYIVRRTDDDFLSAIERRDSIVLVKGARQMGKTSLLARGLQQARATGARIVLTDFQKLNLSHLQSIDTFLMALAESLADQLDLDVFPDEMWNPRRSPNVNFERYLRREALGKIPEAIVWGLDEVDRLFTCDFGGEVFGLFRSWHNERALDPAGPWSRLTLAMAYATEAHLFITDLNQSPFNVGTRLTLEDFTLEQVSDLNQRYGSVLRGETKVARFFRLVGGHPYLVRRGLHEMVTHNLDIAHFEQEADRDEGPFGDHLRRILVLLAQDDQLCEVVRALLRGQGCRDQSSFYRLRSAGVMSGDTTRDVRPRCEVYATYLKKHLL